MSAMKKQFFPRNRLINDFMNELDKLKTEIKNDLMNIKEFFEASLNSYVSSATSGNTGTQPVANDPIQGRKKHFLENYMLVFPSLLYRTILKLGKRIEKIDQGLFTINFKYTNPRNNLCYIGPKGREVEEIRGLRNYFFHGDDMPNKGFADAFKNYPPDKPIELEGKDVTRLIKNCEDAINKII